MTFLLSAMPSFGRLFPVLSSSFRQIANMLHCFITRITLNYYKLHHSISFNRKSRFWRRTSYINSNDTRKGIFESRKRIFEPRERYLSLVIGYSSLVGRYLNLVTGRLKTAGYIALIGQSAMGYCYMVFQVWFRTKQMLWHCYNFDVLLLHADNVYTLPLVKLCSKWLDKTIVITHCHYSCCKCYKVLSLA